MDIYLTPEQIADRLTVKKNTVYSWLRLKKLNGVKLGKIWRVSETDLKSFLSTDKNDNKRLIYELNINKINEFL
jgi:excisionase family DNA binding protein